MTEFVRFKDVECEDCDGEGLVAGSDPGDPQYWIDIVCSGCDGTGIQTVEETDEAGETK